MCRVDNFPKISSFVFFKLHDQFPPNYYKTARDDALLTYCGIPAAFAFLHFYCTKGQLISKGLFAILEFFQTNEQNNSIIVLFCKKRIGSFVFLEELSAWKKNYELVRPLLMYIYRVSLKDPSTLKTHKMIRNKHIYTTKTMDYGLRTNDD